MSDHQDDPRCEHGVDMSVETNTCSECVHKTMHYWEERRAKIAREQRRYEIARDVMAGFSTRQGFCDYIKDWTGDAVLAADALLAALEAK